MTTVTAQEFNRAPSKVKARAKDGPVFITDHGDPSFVLLSIEEYERIKPPTKQNIVDALRMDDEDLADFDIDPGDGYWAGVDESGDFVDLGED